MCLINHLILLCSGLVFYHLSGIEMDAHNHTVLINGISRVIYRRVPLSYFQVFCKTFYSNLDILYTHHISLFFSLISLIIFCKISSMYSSCASFSISKLSRPLKIGLTSIVGDIKCVLKVYSVLSHINFRVS